MAKQRQSNFGSYIEDCPYWQPWDPTPEELAKRTAEVREKKLRQNDYIEKHPDLFYWKFGELLITAGADQRDFRAGCQFLGSGKWRTSFKREE